MPHTVLFLYGSLKRGHSNHHHMAGQTYLGDVVTELRYRIIELGQYGGLIHDDAQGLAVKGELWAVTPECLAALDAFETGEGLWGRFPVAVVGCENVQAYFWTGAIPEGVRSAAEWPFTERGGS